MKNASSVFAITLLLIAGFQISLSAQKTATWKGGTPGRSTDWNCPTNWKEGRVPNEFSHVIIPDVSTSTFYYPVIKEGEIEVLSLQSATTAKIHFQKNARLVILESGLDWESNRNKNTATRLANN